MCTILEYFGGGGCNLLFHNRLYWSAPEQAQCHENEHLKFRCFFWDRVYTNRQKSHTAVSKAPNLAPSTRLAIAVARRFGFGLRSCERPGFDLRKERAPTYLIVCGRPSRLLVCLSPNAPYLRWLCILCPKPLYTKSLIGLFIRKSCGNPNSISLT